MKTCFGFEYLMTVAQESVCVCVLSSGCGERHPADGRTVAGRQTDQDELGHEEAGA